MFLYQNYLLITNSWTGSRNILLDCIPFSILFPVFTSIMAAKGKLSK